MNFAVPKGGLEYIYMQIYANDSLCTIQQLVLMIVSDVFAEACKYNYVLYLCVLCKAYFIYNLGVGVGG